jgi:hypothetical protein
VGVPSKCTVVESREVEAQAAKDSKRSLGKESIRRTDRSASVLQNLKKCHTGRPKSLNNHILND